MSFEMTHRTWFKTKRQWRVRDSSRYNASLTRQIFTMRQRRVRTRNIDASDFTMRQWRVRTRSIDASGRVLTNRMLSFCAKLVKFFLLCVTLSNWEFCQSFKSSKHVFIVWWVMTRRRRVMVRDTTRPWRVKDTRMDASQLWHVSKRLGRVAFKGQQQTHICKTKIVLEKNELSLPFGIRHPHLSL